MKVSVIIRTYNEEAWIGLCLEAIRNQNTTNEIEVVLVDNNSTDKTVEKSRSLWEGLVEVQLDSYKPGLALNKGIEASSGEVVVCLSSHCVPVSNNWLEELVDPLARPKVAAVYGRQVPLKNSSDLDKRDLWITFGLDSKDQHKDPFFHNANSAFLKSTWEERKFDENLTNLEDRVWGKSLIDEELIIHYTPGAEVFHHHGIHQSGDVRRAKGVVSVMQDLHDGDLEYTGDRELLNDVRCLLLVPISPRYDSLDITRFKKNQEIFSELAKKWDVLVLSSSKEQDQMLLEMGFKTLFFRSYESNEDVPPLVDDVRKAINIIEKDHQWFDYVGVIDVHLYDPDVDLIEKMLGKIWESRSDSIVAVDQQERYSLIDAEAKLLEGKKVLLNPGNWGGASSWSKDIVYTANPSRFFISKPNVFRSNKLLGDEVSLYIDEDTLGEL